MASTPISWAWTCFHPWKRFPWERPPRAFRSTSDRLAWESDGIVLLNRVKPHTDFSGKIESGLLKMIAVGMGKAEGALECHHWSWKFGFETVIRAMSAKVLASGKILAGVAVVENEFHQVAALRAADAAGIAAMEEACLETARQWVARIPFPKLDLLIVEELGKNISGTGLDTKIVGRGVELQPGEAPQIRLIYVRDLTPESAGNALGVGLADAIHERLYRKIDLAKDVRQRPNVHESSHAAHSHFLAVRPASAGVASRRTGQSRTRMSSAWPGFATPLTSSALPSPNFWRETLRPFPAGNFFPNRSRQASTIRATSILPGCRGTACRTLLVFVVQPNHEGTASRTPTRAAYDVPSLTPTHRSLKMKASTGDIFRSELNFRHSPCA